MNPDVPPTNPPRRRIGRWILLGLGLLMLPVIFAGIAVASMVTLNHDAAILRKEVMAATDTDWHTRVQVSVGGVTLAAIRTGMIFVHHENIVDARLALAAVRQASLGVYECDSSGMIALPGQMLAKVDAKMKRNGWSRLVGVHEDKETVLIYASDDLATGNRLDLCLAVLDRKQLVVVSTRIDADALGELAARHLPDDVRKQLKIARF